MRRHEVHDVMDDFEHASLGKRIARIVHDNIAMFVADLIYILMFVPGGRVVIHCPYRNVSFSEESHASRAPVEALSKLISYCIMILISLLKAIERSMIDVTYMIYRQQP